MKTIHKYVIGELNSKGETKVKMREHAEILSCIVQNNLIVVYAMVHDDNPMVDRNFIVSGTGWNNDHNVMMGFSFLGTVAIEDLVWHVSYENEWFSTR